MQRAGGKMRPVPVARARTGDGVQDTSNSKARLRQDVTETNMLLKGHKLLDIGDAAKSGIVLTVGTAVDVPHGLGRLPAGACITQCSSNTWPRMYTRAPLADERKIVLFASVANTIVDLYVW